MSDFSGQVSHVTTAYILAKLVGDNLGLSDAEIVDLRKLYLSMSPEDMGKIIDKMIIPKEEE